MKNAKQIFLGLFIGVMLTLSIYGIYAAGVAPALTPSDAWDPAMKSGVANGDALTTAKWNALVNKVELLASKSVDACSFYSKVTSAGDGGQNGEGATCTVSTTGNDGACHSGNGFDFRFNVVTCYKCGASPEVCGSPVALRMAESD